MLIKPFRSLVYTITSFSLPLSLLPASLSIPTASHPFHPHPTPSSDDNTEVCASQTPPPYAGIFISSSERGNNRFHLIAVDF